MYRDELFTEIGDNENNEVMFQLTTNYKTSIREEIEIHILNSNFEKGVELLLEKMLRFLAEMPTNEYHDYREFRHKGLRSYLISRFISEEF